MKNWEDLAPDICRQRLIVEGTLHNIFTPEAMTAYAKEISKVYPSMFQLIKGYMDAESEIDCKKMLQNIFREINGVIEQIV